MITKKEILVKFGERVRAIRKAQELSQEELSFKADLHRTYIGMIERAEKNITLLNIDTYIVFLPLFLDKKIEINYLNNGYYINDSIELEREIILASLNFEYIHEVRTSTDRYNYVTEMQLVDGVYKNVTSAMPIDFEYYNFLIFGNEIVFIEEDFYATNQVFENAYILTIAEFEDQIVIYKKDLKDYLFDNNILELRLSSEFEIFTFLK